MGMQRVSLRIRGKVQGVFFRESTRQEAARLGLTGWVRNREDGSVEALAEGDSAVLEDFIRWCHRGPSTAHVTDLERAESEPTGEFRTFTVEHTS